MTTTTTTQTARHAEIIRRAFDAEMDEQIKASEIKPGMILRIYGGTERIDVTKAVVKWGAVQITDGFDWRGLGEDETVEVLGHFNP